MVGRWPSAWTDVRAASRLCAGPRPRAGPRDAALRVVHACQMPIASAAYPPGDYAAPLLWWSSALAAGDGGRGSPRLLQRRGPTARSWWCAARAVHRAPGSWWAWTEPTFPTPCWRSPSYRPPGTASACGLCSAPRRMPYRTRRSPRGPSRRPWPGGGRSTPMYTAGRWTDWSRSPRERASSSWAPAGATPWPAPSSARSARGCSGRRRPDRGRPSGSLTPRTRIETGITTLRVVVDAHPATAGRGFRPSRDHRQLRGDHRRSGRDHRPARGRLSTAHPERDLTGCCWEEVWLS
ncbi:hypothetical protein SAMN04489717_4219 [Actinopolymorpha singaporensis]|uniref:Uncharacterized protein n=1 Tax=Actinopolymorpha singaporensis TaxID=117157 RepID=A0A1H1VUH5_9ACTN|nr:hypothetical protein SAMN04489717_4219 [Actinopolymorpha singaporensis]